MKLKSLLTLSIASLVLMSGCSINDTHSTLSNSGTSSEQFGASKSSKLKERLSSYYRDQIDQNIDEAIKDAISHQSVITETFKYDVLNENSDLVKEIVKYYRKQLRSKSYVISDIDIEYLQDTKLIVVSMVID